MRARRIGWVILSAATAVGAACTKSADPDEHVSSGSSPPFVVCYEPDGAPCPLLPDGGDDGGNDGGAPDAADAAVDAPLG